jgi:hypothetical protein
MPFEVLETESKDNMPPTALVSYMRPKGRAGKNGAAYDRSKIKPRLTITVPTVICIAKSERFMLLLGTGSDKGKLRIKGTKDKKGVKPTEFKSHFVMRFGHVPKFGDEIFDGERCPLRRLSDEEYEIDIPFELEAGA